MEFVRPITSNQNPRYKNALKLLTSRGRKQQNRILVFGLREVLRASQSGLTYDEFLIDTNLLSSPDIAAVLNLAAANDTALFGLSAELFSKLAYGDRMDGVIGIAPRPETRLEQLSPSEPSILIVLESLEKPGNLGAIARSADGAGIDGVLLADAQTDIFHPNAIRASVSTVFSMPIGTGSSQEVSDWLSAFKFQVFVGTPEAKTSLYETNLSSVSPQRIAFVFGSEARGLSPLWRDRPHLQIKLPMAGIGDSLNVSVTASLMMYEAKRQLCSFR